MTGITLCFWIVLNLFEITAIAEDIKDGSEEIERHDINIDNRKINDGHTDLDSKLFQTLEVLGRG